MTNINTVINSLTAAKEAAYTLASEAAHNGDKEKQRALYSIADQALVAITSAQALEESYPLQEVSGDTSGWDLNNFDEVAE